MIRQPQGLLRGRSLFPSPAFRAKAATTLAAMAAATTLVIGSSTLGVLAFAEAPAQAAASGTLSFAQIEGFWVNAGGSPSTAAIAAAITGAESSYHSGEIQQGTAYCGSGSNRTGWGLWQITCGNSVPQYCIDYQILDPWNNAEATVAKYKSQGFSAWSTYKSGAYKKFLPANPPPPATVTDPGQYVPIGAAPSGTHNASAPGTSCGPAMGRTFSGISVTSAGDGYGLVDTSGENYDFGTAISHGNPSGFTGNIVSVSVTADGNGYAEVSSTGQVYTYGTVRYWGNPTGFSGTITGISVTADGQGYAVVSSAGQNYDYGTVVSRGNPTGFTGNIVGVSVTADGQGYADVSSAGQNYDYGTVVSRGNPTGFTGNIVGVSVTADGQGYADVSSAGQNYDYGTVVSRGNPTGFTGNIVGVSVTANGQGYADVSSVGQVYAYGSVTYRGNA